ncbi:MAG: hypothetical protein ACI396_07210 [Acutalibacteraceae bacterium]
MSENKYPVESYSVDDILREVREMRGISAAPKTDEHKQEKTAAKHDEPTAAHSGDDNSIADTKAQTSEKTAKPTAEPKVERKIPKSAADSLCDDKPQPSNSHVSNSSQQPKEPTLKHNRPNEMHDAQIPHIRPRANVITPDEINSGFSAQPAHITQKRKPKVITADELRGGNDKQSQDDDKPMQKPHPGEVDMQSEGDRLSELFAQKPKTAESKSAKEKIDDLYGIESESKADGEYEETRAERKARIKAEREEEKIRKSEQKAAEKLQKKLAKSKAAANDDDYLPDNPPYDDINDENNGSKVNPNEFFTIQDDSENDDGATKTFDAVSQARGTNNSAADGGSDKTTVFAAVKTESYTDFADKPTADKHKSDNSYDTAQAAESENTEYSEYNDEDKRANYVEPPKKRIKQRSISPVKIEPDKHGETDEQSDRIDDYRNIDDADAIRSGLDSKLSSISKRAFLTFVAAALLGVLTLLPCFGISLPEAISPEKNIKIFLTLNAVIFAFAIILNIKTVINGLFTLVRLRPDFDTPVSVCAIACAVQLGFAFYIPQPFVSGTGCLYTAVSAVAMLFNLLGKRCMFTRIRSNFELVATTGIKQSCFAMKNKKSAVISDYMAPENTTVACQRPVINLHNFLNNSFSEDLSDRVTSVVAPLSLAAALLALVITYFRTGDLSQSIGCLALTATICAPLTTAFAANRPLKKSARRAAELGGLITGYSSVESFADTEYAVVNDYDLFSSGSIELLNLKAVGDNSIDDVIMDAAALVIAANSPLKDVFERMIVGRTSFLKSTDNITYTDGKGLCGNVGGDKIYVGNRQILDGCSDINLPDIEFERKIERKGCFAVYIARNNELCGMLVVRYTVNDDTLCEQLQNLTDSGVMMLVKTCDPNITERLICGAFSLEENTVHVLPADCAKEYDEETLPRESGDSLLAHRNSLAGFACALFSVKRLKFSIMLGVVLQTIGIVLGFAAALYFALIGGYSSVLPSAVLIYQLVCAIIVIAVPSFRKV